MPNNAVRECHVRLFDEDVQELQAIAAETGVSWQIELRLLVRKALRERKIALLEVEPAKKRRSHE